MNKKYRGNRQHRNAHPKIFVWSHTDKAEIEYFQEFKNHLKTPLLMPCKELCVMPHQLIARVVKWKQKMINEDDGDRVWCIFDVDDFYKDNPSSLLLAINNAHKNNIRIAYINECFEHWVLLHFEKISSLVSRGSEIENRIRKAFIKNNLGEFQKNQKVFQSLLPFQKNAIKNAESLMPNKYEEINWQIVLGNDGNPSTTIHLLIEEINQLLRDKQ